MKTETYKSPGDVQAFNEAVMAFDDWTGGVFDRLEPQHMARYLAERLGSTSTFYRTFVVSAKRMGYEL